MGAQFRLTEDGQRHVSTGKFPFPAGQEHEPEWGPWFRDMGGWMRQCQFMKNECDIDDYSKTGPEDAK